MPSQSLFKSASIYAITNILNAAIPFFLLPVFTRYLNPLDYGLVSIFSILISFVMPLTGLSIHGLIIVKFFDKNCADIKKYISSCLLILVVSSTFLAIIFWIFAKQIAEISAFPELWLWAVLAVAITQIIIQVNLSLWQATNKTKHYGLFQLFQVLVNSGLSLLFIINLSMNWQGRIIAQVITSVLFGLVSLLVLWKDGWLKYEIDYTYVVDSLKFGIPIIPHELAGWAMAATDRMFISNMIGLKETGIYSVGFQLAMIISIIESSFNSAWVPWLFNKLKNNALSDKIRIVKLTYIYVFGIIVFAITLASVTPMALHFFVGRDFQGAAKFVFWLALSKGIYSMYFMTCNYLFYTQKTGFIAIATVSSAFIHIAATYYFIKISGAVGAAQASILSTSTLVILTWVFSYRAYKMPWLLTR